MAGNDSWHVPKTRRGNSHSLLDGSSISRAHSHSAYGMRDLQHSFGRGAPSAFARPPRRIQPGPAIARKKSWYRMGENRRFLQIGGDISIKITYRCPTSNFRNKTLGIAGSAQRRIWSEE